MLLVNSICSAHSLPLIGSHRRDRWPKFGVSIGLAFADTLSDRFWPNAGFGEGQIRVVSGQS